MGVGLKWDNKDFVTLDLSFCSFLSGALKRDRFRYGDIQRVFGAGIPLPFQYGPRSSSYQKEEIERSGDSVQRAGEKSRKQWKKIGGGMYEWGERQIDSLCKNESKC